MAVVGNVIIGGPHVICGVFAGVPPVIVDCNNGGVDRDSYLFCDLVIFRGEGVDHYFD